MQQKKTRGQNIDPSQSYGQMNFQKIQIHSESEKLRFYFVHNFG